MKNDFEYGKWYRSLSDPNSFIKFSLKEEVYNFNNEHIYNRIHYSENITKGFHHYTSGHWANEDYELHALNNPVTIDEIIPFLPFNHQDIPLVEDDSYNEILITLLNNIK